MLSARLSERRVLVSCGAGGVGKTTLSAALALGAARRGLRVLVITIDPSRRLAETLGVSRNPRQPVPLPEDKLREAGVTTGTLHAWMLDPQLIADSAVERLGGEDAARLLRNRLYQNISAMVAGMQEYTAVEALYRFVQADLYDLIILDTPPSRDALRFLEAPRRLGALLNQRVFDLFLPERPGFIQRVAGRLIEGVFDVVLGKATRAELQEFLVLFAGIFQRLNQNQEEMRRFFAAQEVGFLLVTAPNEAALEEAYYFERKTRDELGLNLEGYILNRSLAHTADWPLPDPEAPGLDPTLRAALLKLAPLAKAERVRALADLELTRALAARLPGGFVQALPTLEFGANDIPALARLSEILLCPEATEATPTV
ncbi:AAA family ATPase [Myxococcota bacterium]|nr:AAA family ATPase [Myxococcota bacterium]MBU1432872.1 AAA family ATPase [Myxococcota bacterium]MBU1898579.1 AAA family ATPase [Myxococcota bacterium]